MTAFDIVEAARDKLGDTGKSGWLDARLLRLVNAGQKDICKSTSIYRKKAFIPLLNFVTSYALPDDCFAITRLEHNKEQLPIYSREDVDRTLVVADKYAVKSNINRGIIEVYPAYTELEFFDDYVEGNYYTGDTISIDELGCITQADEFCIVNELGVVTALYEVLEDREATQYGSICGLNLFHLIKPTGAVLGEISAITASTDSQEFGLLTALNSNSQMDTIYGVCTGFALDETVLTVYYNAIPPKIDSLNDALVLDDIWFDAMIYYVTGIARQDDNDEGNYKIGELELLKYADEVLKAKKISSKSFNTQVSTVRETIYRRF